MGTVDLTLPAVLHERVVELAKKNNVSIDFFVATALAEKVSVLLTEDYLAELSQNKYFDPARMSR